MRFAARSKNGMPFSGLLCARNEMRLSGHTVACSSFSAVDGATSGGLATIDLDLARLESLDRLDRDPDVRKALVRIFSMALGGISGVEKK